MRFIKKTRFEIFFMKYRHKNTKHCEWFAIALFNVLFSSLHGLVVKRIGILTGKIKNYLLSVPLDFKKK